MKSVVFLAVFIFLILGSTAVNAMCPVDTPAMCEIDQQLANGRWDLSQVNGQYTLSGNEVFCEFLDEGFCDLADDYDPVTGQFEVNRLGGVDENYIEVACDGSIIGQGHEQINGTLDKTANIQYGVVICGELEPQDMSWDVTIDRQYDITGQVTGAGQVELTYGNDVSTISINGTLARGDDCFWSIYPINLNNFEISGAPEEVTLSGSYDANSYSWNPSVNSIGGTSWLDDVLHRLALNDSTADDVTLESAGFSQPVDQLYNTYFIQNTVTVTDDISHDATPSMPTITSVELTEPFQYLMDVAVDTELMATIDWRGQSPGEVEFTYGGTVETVAGNTTVNWQFDAGEPGTKIEVVAIKDDERSVPYVLAVPKVSLPIWAQSPGDWTGTAGVEYEGMLNWPLSLDTTRNLNTLALFTGDWGLSNASSEYNAMVFSDGSSGPGDMNTQVTFNFAGKSVDFEIQGQNNSDLSCDMMSTDGDATIEIPIPGWQKTLNPLTAIPGLQSAACGLSGLLCDVIQSIGIKASASANVSGTGQYAGDTADIMWTGGTVGGSISAQAGAGIQLPKPLHQVAGASVSGGGSGCIEFQVAPDFTLGQLGAQIDLSANAFFMGLSASAEQSWPIGDGCGGRAVSDVSNGNTAWVPEDGHLAMTQHWHEADMQGVAVWSANINGQARPAGQLNYRFYDGSSDTWGDVLTIPVLADVNHSPAIRFDDQGHLLVVFQSNTTAVPTEPSQLSNFADGYELHWVLIDPVTSGIIDEGQITQNDKHDFGPRLMATNHDINLFWQRASGIEITGTMASPVSIQSIHWDANSQSWGAESVVLENLVNTYGWSAAMRTDDEKLLLLTVDTDGDYTTPSDRELFRYVQSNGVWGVAEPVTNDLISDDHGLIDYDYLGNELMFWRSGQELATSFAVDTAVIPLQDAEYLDGLGNGFSQAELAQQQELKTLVWSQSTALMLSKANQQGEWETAEILQPAMNDVAQNVYTTTIKAGQLHYGWASRAQSGNGYSDQMTPYFSNALAFDEIFSDGFQ